jgi:hypothetical protein
MWSKLIKIKIILIVYAVANVEVEKGDQSLK